MCQTLLGFDFGMKRIGIAVGQTITHTATPLTCLTARDGVPNWQQLQDLIKTWQVDALVVGIPLNMDGSNQLLTYQATRFANKLRERYGLPVYHVDERLTTVAARNTLKCKDVDSYAAKLILESWLKQDSPEDN